jgi:HK97 gp10 family phage protein
MVTMKFDQKSIDEVIKKLNGIGPAIEKERRKILLKAAKPLVAAARAKVKSSSAVHKRYAFKGKNAKKAGKGAGKVIATYSPGNLNRSIGTLQLRKTDNVYVGPRFKRDPAGDYGSATKVDGYYAHMVEYGTKHNTAKPFMRPAYEETKGTVVDIIGKEVKKTIEKYAK